MEEFEKVFGILYDIGVSQEVAKDIVLTEIFGNAKKYAGNQDAIDEMLQEKLTIDQYIALIQYKIF